jgi:hypothetical protein
MRSGGHEMVVLLDLSVWRSMDKIAQEAQQQGMSESRNEILTSQTPEPFRSALIDIVARHLHRSLI